MTIDDESIYKPEDTLFPPKITLQIKGKLYLLRQPWIMGILNITPDSFYAKSRWEGERQGVLAEAEIMLGQGAQILDIGGYSSRPGAGDVSEKTELNRVIPVISSIKNKFPDALISIDTFRHKIASEAVKAGADIVNDISGGGMDEYMIETVGSLGAPYVCMHMKGTPTTMQSLKSYHHLEKEILEYFSEKISHCHQAGIKDVIVDVGLGFSKTMDQNYRLIKNLPFFKTLQVPLLVGVSRKSMIYKLLNCTPENALNGTTALNMAALMNGVQILRVHDIKAANETIKLFKQIYP
ncbi:MAG: dihydropteroate synthase [Cyclobacteriaceae bacterium]